VQLRLMTWPLMRQGQEFEAFLGRKKNGCGLKALTRAIFVVLGLENWIGLGMLRNRPGLCSLLEGDLHMPAMPGVNHRERREYGCRDG
jgi:hypothetical protein